MIKAIFTHPVADYAKWRAVFDASQHLTKQAGGRNATVCTSVDNPNLVSVHADWDSVEKVNAFASNPQLMEAMQKSGVLEKPTLTIWEVK